MLFALLGLDVLFQISEILITLRGGTDSGGLELVLYGPYWWVWIIQLVIGSAIPLALLSIKKTKENPLTVVLASVMIVIGLLGMRLNIVIPGQAVEEIA